MATPYDKAYNQLMFATSNASVAMGAAIGNSTKLMNDATAEAITYLNKNFAAGQAYLTPYRVAGQQSITQLNNITGVNGAHKQADSLNNIMIPVLNTMQQYGSNIANQAMANFLGTVAPNYNFQQNVPAMNQAAASQQQQQTSTTSTSSNNGYTPYSAPNNSTSGAQQAYGDNAYQSYAYQQVTQQGSPAYEKAHTQWAKDMNKWVTDGSKGTPPASPKFEGVNGAGPVQPPWNLNGPNSFQVVRDAASNGISVNGPGYQGPSNGAPPSYSGDQYDAAYAASSKPFQKYVDQGILTNDEAKSMTMGQVADVNVVNSYLAKINKDGGGNFKYQGTADGVMPDNTPISNYSKSDGVSLQDFLQQSGGTGGGVPSPGAYSFYGGQPVNQPQQQSPSTGGPQSGQPTNFSGVMGGIVDQVTNNPLVQTMLTYLQKQGQQQYQSSAASKGMLNSGRTLEELQTQGQGIAATNVMPLVNNLLNQIVGGVSAIQQSYIGNTIQGGAAAASNAVSSVQNSLGNMIQQGNAAAQTGAQLAGQQGQVGSSYTMQAGQYAANNELLRGKVQSDAMNAMAQIQFQHDMGPYVNSLGATPQAQGYGTSGGGGMNNTPMIQTPSMGSTGIANYPWVPQGGSQTASGFIVNSAGQDMTAASNGGYYGSSA